MKKTLRNILFTLLMLMAPYLPELNAQPPTPPGTGSQPGNAPMGGGAPIEGGIAILITLAASYSISKMKLGAKKVEE